MTGYYCNDGFLWFRVFGYGLKIKDVTKHGLIFSERIGKTKKLIIGKWCIGILKPTRINTQDERTYPKMKTIAVTRVDFEKIFPGFYRPDTNDNTHPTGREAGNDSNHKEIKST
jgi:hypothetical protein